MASNKIKGGRKRELSSLQLRREAWNGKDGTKRPGSNKK
jgi:hypothetical protein